MGIVKREHNIERVEFVFSDTGEVTDIELQVNYQLYDEVAAKQVTRATVVESVWGHLNNGEKIQAKALGKLLKALAEEF